MSDQTLNITPEVLQQLAALRAELKFQKEDFYPGAPTEEIRRRSENAVNTMLDTIRSELSRSPQKAYVLSEFLVMLAAFESADSEEREQACSYCERVMEILNIESSDGVLNKW